MNGRGQLTVPAEIRAELGWKPGDRFEFVYEDEDEKIVPMRLSEGDSHCERPVRRTRGSAPTALSKSTEELMAMLRDD